MANNNELLSAYLDGELTPEELAAVERLLDQSDDARRELAEISAVSELIRSLPHEPAPQEMAPAVLDRAERETLLQGIAPSAIAKPASRRRSWMAIAATAAATVAALVAMALLLPERDGQPTIARNEQTPAGATLAELQEELVAEKAGDGDTPDEGRNLAMTKTADAGAAEGLQRRDSISIADSGAAGGLPSAGGSENGKRKLGRSKEPAPANAGQPFEKLPSRRVERAASSQAKANNRQMLRNARPGDVVPYVALDATGERIDTYMVTVVDVQQAVDKLQLLLASNEIPVRETAQTSARPIASDEAEPSSPEAEPHLFAVYVETTPDRFASTLKSLRRNEFFADLQTGPPVEELRVEIVDAQNRYRPLFGQGEPDGRADDKAKSEFYQYKQRQRANEPTPVASSPEKSAAGSQERAGAKQIRRHKDAPAVSDAVAGDFVNRAAVAARNPVLEAGAELSVASAHNSSFQVRVHVGRDALDKLDAQAILSKSAQEASRFAGQAENKAASQRVAQKPALIRALFVFRQLPRGSGMN